MDAGDQQPRSPLPRFGEKEAAPEKRGERKSEGFRLVSEDELNLERNMWSEKLQSDMQRMQTGCFAKMEELLSSQESRMNSEVLQVQTTMQSMMRQVMAEREVERADRLSTSDSVQGDSGGSREGVSALSIRLNQVESALAADSGKVKTIMNELEQLKSAMTLLTAELTEERKERRDVSQLAEMAVHTTRCLTEGLSEGGSSNTTTAATPMDDGRTMKFDGDRIYEQLAGRIGAVAQELRSEVRSELLVALRSELSAEMARKVATFQARIAALESSVGGAFQHFMRDVADRVSNIEAAQSDATQVRERLLAVEARMGSSEASLGSAMVPPTFASLGSQGLDRSDRSAPQFQAAARSQSPQRRPAPDSGFGMQLGRNNMNQQTVFEGEAVIADRAAPTGSSLGEETSTIADADLVSGKESDHGDSQGFNLMTSTLKSELEGLVNAVSSIITQEPGQKPRLSSGNPRPSSVIPARQLSTNTAFDRSESMASRTTEVRGGAVGTHRGMARSPSPTADAFGKSKQVPSRMASVDASPPQVGMTPRDVITSYPRSSSVKQEPASAPMMSPSTQIRGTVIGGGSFRTMHKSLVPTVADGRSAVSPSSLNASLNQAVQGGSSPAGNAGPGSLRTGSVSLPVQGARSPSSGIAERLPAAASYKNPMKPS